MPVNRHLQNVLNVVNDPVGYGVPENYPQWLKTNLDTFVGYAIGDGVVFSEAVAQLGSPAAGSALYEIIREAFTRRGRPTTATTPAVTVPPSPVVNAASSVASTGFTANWSGSSGAAGYRLDVSPNSVFSTFVSGYNNLDVGNVTSRGVAGLSANTPYFYRVRAYNSAGVSGNSGTAAVDTGTGTSTVPAGDGITSLPIIGSIIGSISESIGFSPMVVLLVSGAALAWGLGVFDSGPARRRNPSKRNSRKRRRRARR